MGGGRPARDINNHVESQVPRTTNIVLRAANCEVGTGASEVQMAIVEAAEENKAARIGD